MRTDIDLDGDRNSGSYADLTIVDATVVGADPMHEASHRVQTTSAHNKSDFSAGSPRDRTKTSTGKTRATSTLEAA